MPRYETVSVYMGDDGQLYFVNMGGTKVSISTSNLALAAIVHCTTADPASPVDGQIWLRTDL